MRVVVDFDLCEGNGLCEQLVPEVFHVDGDGDLHLRTESPEATMHDRLLAAVRSCPRGAISLR